MLGYVLILCAAAMNAVANLLLKLATDKGISLTLDGGIGQLVVNHWQLVTGLTLFALNVAIYIFALRLLPLSVAYPTMLAISFIIIGTASVFLLGEHMTLIKVLGYLTIVLGIVLVSSAQLL